MESSPHSLFVSDPPRCWQLLEDFLIRQALLEPKALDKREVARSFSRAAATYDSVAELQRRIGQQLLAKADPDKTVDLPATILDAGCGTGFFTAPLQQVFADSRVIGLDLAEGMLDYAASHHEPEQTDKALWLCGDVEQLPLADHSVDVIFSSLAIQWCENHRQLFGELYRVLKPGGQLLVATLGPETLRELRQAWQQVDHYVHVNRFVGRDALQHSMVAAGFEVHDGSIEEQLITLSYARLTDLTRELKALGAHNLNRGRNTGLTGKQQLRQLMAAYDQQRDDSGRLPASWQAWFITLHKTANGTAQVSYG